MLVMSVMAVPAKRGLYTTVTLTDGTEVKVELRGDEFCHFWQAEDGRKFVKDLSTGLFKTADIATLTAKADVKRRPALANRAKRAARKVEAGNTSLYQGKKKGLIILVDFTDKTFAEGHDSVLYNRIANEEGFTHDDGFIGSVKDYFKAQSYGQFELDFDIAGPVTMPNGYTYYGANDSSGNDDYTKIAELVITACKAIDSNIDFSQYDWDGDGYVDQVFILFAGHGENSYSDENTIWPHEYNLEGAGGTYNDSGLLLVAGDTPELDGVKVNTYACSCELGSSEKIDGIGTICHEFSHCLGLPDMYDTSYSGYYGMGSWSLMDAGNYNGDGFCPANYTSYERTFIGWITPVELYNDTTVTGMKALADGGEAYIIYNEGHKDEYYMLENRQLTGWDAQLPNSGMLILHVDYDKTYWDYNYVNSTSTQHCTIFAADNVLSKTSTVATDPYPYKSASSGKILNNELTNVSSPAAKLNNANTDGSYYMNKSVTDIALSEDGTMSFNFSNEINVPAEYTIPTNKIFYESFDKCAGTGGNDGSFNASTSAGSVPSYADNEGWTTTSGRPANKCALFGSSVTTGQATTPAIDINGEYTLWFRAAPYDSGSNCINVEVSEGDATLSKTTFITKSGAWIVGKTTVKGTGESKLRFYVSNGRFYLDDVCVGTEDETGINCIAVSGNNRNNGRIFSIDGRYVGRDIKALRRGIYILNGKKVIVSE